MVTARRRNSLFILCSRGERVNARIGGLRSVNHGPMSLVQSLVNIARAMKDTSNIFFVNVNTIFSINSHFFLSRYRPKKSFDNVLIGRVEHHLKHQYLIHLIPKCITHGTYLLSVIIVLMSAKYNMVNMQNSC